MPDNLTAALVVEQGGAQDAMLRRQCLEWALMYRGNDSTGTILKFADDLQAYVREGKKD